MIELQISQITDFIKPYRRNWKEQVERMNSYGSPQKVMTTGKDTHEDLYKAVNVLFYISVTCQLSLIVGRMMTCECGTNNTVQLVIEIKLIDP
jgi:hypothetical protein